MSVATYIASIETSRNTIRNKLVELGMAASGDKLDKLATAIEGIINQGAVSITVKEGDTYTIPKGYHNGSGTVSAINSIPDGGDGVTVEQATPTIVVDHYGKITATAIQEAGQVEAGTKTATYQMSTLGYTEYTPGVDDQYLPIYRYVVGSQIIKGDANLVPGNIKKDVSIFNIVGTYEDSDSGNNGIVLPTLSNPGSAEDLLYGKQLIDADGKIVNGTMDFITPENTSFYLPATNIEEYEDAYGKRAMMSIQLPNRLAFEAGSTARMQSNLLNFGNAKPEDVIDGATFTSAEGLNVSGTLPFHPAGQRAYIGLAEEASRMDYAAYPVVRATAPIRVRLAMDAESSAQVDIPFWRLPGAEPNLLAENIKKGISIFDVVGTYEGSGGGSGVISAVATGTYTPASDISSGVEIAHGLGVTPNFCIWMAENDFSDITDVSAAVVGAMVAKPMLHSVSSGMTYHYQYFLRGYNVSGLSNGTASYKSEGCMTDTIVTILGNSTYKLKSGLTYRWVAGVINA